MFWYHSNNKKIWEKMYQTAKLEEARFFLDRLKREIGNNTSVKHFLSAFLSAV